MYLNVSVENYILEVTHLEGRRVYEDSWKDFDMTDLQAYIGLLILAEVYKSKG